MTEPENAIGIKNLEIENKKKVAGLATHSKGYAYGCSVPRLTRFASDACMGPDHIFCSWRPAFRKAT